MSKPVLAPSGYKALLKKRQAAIPDLSPTQNNSIDPFAPTSPGDINSTVNKYTSMYGTPQTDAQIQSGAQNELNPIIAAITKNITDQAGTASANIKGNSESLANSLGQIDYGAPYAAAESGQAASDAALRGALAGDGGSLAADLQSRLAAINDPTVAAAGSAVSGYGNAAGNTELANGGANLGALLAEAAAAKTYGLKEPGIARLSGLQDISGVEQNATNQIGDQTTSVLSQLPNIVQAMQSSNQSLKGDRAGAAAQIYETLTGQNVTKATAKAGLENTAFDNGIAQENADTSAFRASTAAKTAAVKTAAAKKPKPLTVPEKTSTAATANTVAAQAFHGAPAVMNANGTVKEPALKKLNRQQALDEMRQEGLLADPRTAKIAIAALNRLYGKPLTPAEQKKQDAAVAAGLGVPKLTGPLAGLGG